MQEHTTEGITLQSLPFKEKKRLISIYTPVYGILSFVASITPKRSDLLSITSGFCLAEFIYKRGRSDLFSLLEASIIDEHFFLRQNLDSLQAAAFMAKIILQTQPPPKASPHIYLLFKKFLHKLENSPAAPTLAFSFSLKVLQHEGFLHIHPLCNICKKQPSTVICSGESLCHQHAPSYGNHFTQEEFAHLLCLLQERSFSQLEKIPWDSKKEEKLEKMIQEIL